MRACSDVRRERVEQGGGREEGWRRGDRVTVTVAVVQDAASRRAGLQNGNPQDYCTYKRFTVRGPFARAKGRPRSLWQQTGGSQHLPFYFSGCKPSAPRRLSLSLRQVILLHRPAATATTTAILSPPPTRLLPFFLSILSFTRVSSVRPRFLACRLLVRSSDSQTSSRVDAAALGDPVCVLRFFPFPDGISEKQKAHAAFVYASRDIIIDLSYASVLFLTGELGNVSAENREASNAGLVEKQRDLSRNGRILPLASEMYIVEKISRVARSRAKNVANIEPKISIFFSGEIC